MISTILVPKNAREKARPATAVNALAGLGENTVTVRLLPRALVSWTLREPKFNKHWIFAIGTKKIIIPQAFPVRTVTTQSMTIA